MKILRYLANVPSWDIELLPPLSSEKMSFVTVAAATLPSIPLDFKGNRDRILESIRISKRKGATIRTGPEVRGRRGIFRVIGGWWPGLHATFIGPL